VFRLHPNPGTMAGFDNLRSLFGLSSVHHATKLFMDGPCWAQSPRHFRDIEIVHGPIGASSGIADIGRVVGILGGASICSGNFSMLRMLVASGFLRGRYLPCRSWKHHTPIR
jgi:hypothetical protein